MYADGTGFGHPWELIPLGNFTLRTKDGLINGYKSEFQMAVRCNLTSLNCVAVVHYITLLEKGPGTHHESILSCGQALPRRI